MVQLFDAIAEHVGNRQRIPTAKVHALKEAFKLGCEDDKTDTEEKDAIGAFLRVLDAIMGDQVTVTRSEWVDYVPAKNAYTPKEVEVLNEILRNVLDSPEARSGLFAEMDGDEGEEEDGNTLHNAELYVRVMTLLFDRVLDPKQTGQVVEKRVNALGKALKEGCDEADEDEDDSDSSDDDDKTADGANGNLPKRRRPKVAVYLKPTHWCQCCWSSFRTKVDPVSGEKVEDARMEDQILARY